MMIRLGVIAVILGIVLIAVGQKRRLTKLDVDGPDNRPNYYKAMGVSLWPYEMPKTTRHGLGRAWLDIYPTGSASIEDGVRTAEQHLDVLLWSQVQIESIRIFDVTADQLLLAKDGAEILACGELSGMTTTVFPRRYVLCSVALPPIDHVVMVEVVDQNVNEFRKIINLDEIDIPRQLIQRF